MNVHTEVSQQVRRHRDQLIALSHAVHEDAELRFEEYRSSRRVADALSGSGFDVDFGVCGLDTAFSATYGSGELTIAICAEYDALPRIGHACGHNVIAAAAVGAGHALKQVADDLGITVRVLGTPGEEGGGGKIIMLDRGAFDGVHAAMMVHPAPNESTYMNCLAVQHLDVTFTGTSAHAAAYPQLGVNAADALTVSEVAIGLLRQHIAPTDRIHGIVTYGGDAPNVVPHHTTGRWYVRSADMEGLQALLPRVTRCFEAGALATGCEVDVNGPGHAYSEFHTHPAMADVWEHVAREVGRPTPLTGNGPLVGSTDMANISRVIPTIHPMLAIDTDGAVNHQPEFAAAAINASADMAILDGAMGMASTVATIATDPGLRAELLARSYRSTPA